MDDESIGGPYCDLETGNVVYQVPEWPQGLKWNGKEGVSVDPDYLDRESFRDLMQKRRTSGVAFSKEWYENVAEESRSVEVPSALKLFVELFSDGLIEGKTPQEVLGIEPDADLFEAHKAYKRLSMLLHPDRIHARVLELREQFLRGIAPDNKNLWSGFLRLLRPIQDAMGTRGEALSEEELAKLSSRKRRAYIKKHEEALRRESESMHLLVERWTELEKDLVAKTGEQMTRLNRAYEAIKKGYSEADFTGISSLWERHEWRLPEDYNHVFHIEDRIPLMGDGYLYRNLDYRREEGEFVIEKVGMAYLRCATGYDRVKPIYTIDRIMIPIKVLFAFLELRDGKIIHPALLTDLAEEFGLDAAESEELRRMLCEHQSPGAICKRFVKEHQEPLELASAWFSEEELEDDPKVLTYDYGAFGKWISMILEGPRYDWYDDYDLFGHGPGAFFGIEYSRSGSLHILLPCQRSPWSSYRHNDELPIERVVFPPEDVAVMKQIAYSRSLGQQKKSVLIG